MTTYAPNDDIFGPVISALTTIAGEIAGVSRVYTSLIDGQFEDNSVVIDYGDPLASFDWETNSKNEITFDLTLLHLFIRRGNLDELLTTIRSYLHPWLDALGAESNVMLSGAADVFYPTRVRLRSLKWSGQDYLALQIDLSVKVLINIQP